jgi:hypothetical protein
MALVERARRVAMTKGNLGPSVPADFFVWAREDPAHPWLTQVGGQPWREEGKPWPRDPEGIPLHFLGQICFSDSADILPCKLPGEVALIFGRWEDGWAFVEDVGVLEWAPLELRKPAWRSAGWTTRLPFCYSGVIHRSRQYVDEERAESAFRAAGREEGGYGIYNIQASSVSTSAYLPQGWPFTDGDGNTLVATLSSVYFGGLWSLCDAPRSIPYVRHDGREFSAISVNALSLGIGDTGCIWIYRDEEGEFHLDSAHG